MNDTVRQKLREIVGRYGLSVCDNSRRCEGLLRDLCPECKLEINSLIAILKEGIPQELSRSSNVFPLEVTLPKLIKLSIENLGLSEEIARWSVETWAFALGITSGGQSAPVNSQSAIQGGGLTTEASTPGKPANSAQRKPTTTSGTNAKTNKRNLTLSNLKRYSVVDALQFPVTLLFLVLTILLLAYLSLLSATFGFVWMAATLMIVAGLAAGVSCYFRYPIEYARNYRQLNNEQIAVREKQEAEELFKLEESLLARFLDVHSLEGTKVLNAMSNEYKQFISFLDSLTSIDPLAVSTLRSQGNETLRNGINILADTHDLMKLVQGNNRNKLESEVAATEKEIALLQNQPNRLEYLNFKKEVLGFLKLRISVWNQLQLCIEQLFRQAERCEVSLRAARFELASIRSGNTKNDAEYVVATLLESQVKVKEAQTSLMRKAGDLLREDHEPPAAQAKKA